MIYVPLRVYNGLNNRECWQARARRVKKERQTTGWALAVSREVKPGLPCIIKMTRVYPPQARKLNDDNLAGALKGVRDAIAEWLGVDDAREDVTRYEYAQRRGKTLEWAVEIEFMH